MFNEGNETDVSGIEVIDLRRPSLRGLAYLLRHKELWPEGFEFDYYDPFSCAIGLGRRVWNVPYPDRNIHPESLHDIPQLGMTKGQYSLIFSWIGVYYNMRPVTADMAADYIDAMIG